VSSFIFDPEVQYDMRSPEVWDSGTFFTHIRSSVIRLLSAVEDRGKELVAFDFISEPVVREHGVSRAPKLWPKLVGDISGIMESRSPDRWLVVSSAPWGAAEGYKNFSPLNYSRVIYGVHIYMPHAFTHQGINKGINSSLTPQKYPGWVRFRYWDKQKIEEKLKPLREFQEKYNVPVLVGEFSTVRWADGGEKYIEDVASIANGYNWDWLYFSATGWHGWNPDYKHRNSWDENDRSYLENDREGDTSERWVTLRKIFSMNKKGITH
jgi:endoglucanase